MKQNLTWIGFAGLMALAVSGCNSAGKGETIRKEAAGPAKLRDAVRLTGTVEPVEQVDLKSEVSGRILDVPVREGDSVKAGQLLVRLDPEPFVIRKDKAALQVARLALAMKVAERDLARAKALEPSGTISGNQIEDLEVALERAKIEWRDAGLSLKDAEKSIKDSRIVAPMPGRLITLSVEKGEVVSSATAANGGTLLGVVADPRRMKVVVEVGELDYPRLKVGMPVEVSTATENAKALKGRVSFVSSSARQSSASASIRVFPVEVVVDSASGVLVSGMTVAVDFVFFEKRVDVAVPFEAVKEGKAGKSTVMVPGEKGKPQPRSVKAGLTDYRMTEISIEGIAAGDTVILPSETAKAGAASGAKGPGR